MNTRKLRTPAIAMGTTLLLPLAACSSPTHHAGSISSIRANPSPAMHTLAGRGDDRLNDLTVTADTNFRQFHTDLDRALYIDRPSRLHFNIKPY